uniref:Uncharacterized protein n=1 Tax=Brassica oleracea var. oleracea TaxID=109376 RepID=A0A0D3BLP6_BRAOL
MASSSHYHYHRGDDNAFETVFDDIFEDLEAIPEPKERKKRIFIERNREEGHNNLQDERNSDTLEEFQDDDFTFTVKKAKNPAI